MKRLLDNHAAVVHFLVNVDVFDVIGNQVLLKLDTMIVVLVNQES